MSKYFKILLGVAVAAISFTACLEDADNNNTSNLNSPVVNNAQVGPESLTAIEWIDSAQNLGAINEGQMLEVSFKFKNVGNKPLTIASATPSCGCTVPQKPEKPILPGQEGEIKAIFDSKGRPGANHKTISVIANTIGSVSHTLVFDVNVNNSKDGPKAVTEEQPSNTF